MHSRKRFLSTHFPPFEKECFLQNYSTEPSLLLLLLLRCNPDASQLDPNVLRGFPAVLFAVSEKDLVKAGLGFPAENAPLPLVPPPDDKDKSLFRRSRCRRYRVDRGTIASGQGVEGGLLFFQVYFLMLHGVRFCNPRSFQRSRKITKYYKYCHNSVNNGDIRDLSAYLGTTDNTVYQGICRI